MLGVEDLLEEMELLRLELWGRDWREHLLLKLMQELDLLMRGILEDSLEYGLLYSLLVSNSDTVSASNWFRSSMLKLLSNSTESSCSRFSR